MHVSEKDSGNQNFLSELKQQHNEYLTLRNLLDNKAHNSITLSSGILTILGGIGTFLVTSIKHTDPIFLPIGILLIIGILSAVVGMLFFILSYKLRGYRYPFGAKNLVFESKDSKSEKKEPTINPENLTKFLELSKQQLLIHSIKEHLLSINHNANSNKEKAKWIKFGHWCFLGSISCIVGIILWVIIYLLLGNTIELIK
jgi:hypothetical protein